MAEVEDAIASFLPNGHPSKFSLITPKEVFRTMRETQVHCAPTPERICEDINGFDHVLDKIIESEGTIVKGEALRHGRRAMNHKGDDQLTTRLRSAQRKSTLQMTEIHPELKFIRDEIIKSEDGHINIEAVLERLAENTAEAERQGLAKEIIEELQQENVEEGTIGEDLGNDMEGEEEE